MAVTDVAIATRAARLLKAGQVTNLADTDKVSKTLNDIFVYVREELLRAHKWKFAREYVKLTRLATAPAFGYDYAYGLPSDWIRTVSVHDNDAGLGIINDYEESSITDTTRKGAIFTSVEDVYMKYVYAETDPTRMPPDFQTAFAYALAVEAPGISNISTTAWDRLEKVAARKLIRAKAADSLSSPPQRRPAGSWATSRQTWPSSRWPR